MSTVLENYPDINQNTTGSNGWRNCVPASIDDGLEWLTGQRIGVQTLLDEAYGPNYAGFCSASAFVASCAKRGVKLFPIDKTTGGELVQAMHQQLQALHPVVATEPDVWAKDHPDWSHVLSFFKEDAGTLTARDPYSTLDVTHPDSEWAKLFEFHEIWVMEILEMVKPLDITMPEVAHLFRQLDATHWQSLETGCILHDALLKDYIANGVASLERLGDVMSNEIYGNNGDSVQYHEFGARLWSKATGKVTSLDLFNPPGSSLPRLVSPGQTVAAPQEHALLTQFVEQGATLLGRKLV